MTSTKVPDTDEDVVSTLAELAGELNEAMSDEPFDGAAYDRDYPEHLRKTIY